MKRKTLDMFFRFCAFWATVTIIKHNLNYYNDVVTNTFFLIIFGIIPVIYCLLYPLLWFSSKEIQLNAKKRK